VGPAGLAGTALDAVHRYHDGTKHDFGRFARSLGYLDWASQPRPFREYLAAPCFPLYPAPAAAADGYAPGATTYDRLFDLRPATPLSAALLGDVLRHALGLSAWKRFEGTRWALRVNPSSGNLHPTEAYVVCGAIPGLADTPAVYHYAADRHALELRCAFDGRAWNPAEGERLTVLVALTSIHWRESWKYGERAFRYCQHDIGHAIAALSLAASLVGWQAVLLPSWSVRQIAALTGVDRDEDFREAEREEPACIAALSPAGVEAFAGPAALVEAVRQGRWSGRPSQLSEDHVQWTFIDEIARATEWPGTQPPSLPDAPPTPPTPAAPSRERRIEARSILLKRRSAVAFDGRSAMQRTAFFDLLYRVMPGPRAPWNAFWWTPRIHLAIFVHRVEDLPPGLYLLPRNATAVDRLKAACRREFAWETAHGELPLFCLARGVCRVPAQRVSCDQAIAADGFFSLGMIADFDSSLEEHGAPFYRQLFWESGLVGQILYLESEAAGARGTGIGCFYDDPVHTILGLEGHAFQSLYHFSAGAPVEDTRLTTEPGYQWESSKAEV
jgi:SagB-type dehydrogenase family enzyme